MHVAWGTWVLDRDSPANPRAFRQRVHRGVVRILENRHRVSCGNQPTPVCKTDRIITSTELSETFDISWVTGSHRVAATRSNGELHLAALPSSEVVGTVFSLQRLNPLLRPRRTRRTSSAENGSSENRPRPLTSCRRTRSCRRNWGVLTISGSKGGFNGTQRSDH